MPATIKRIAINTGGGDAPGLNAVIRAATLTAIRRGWEVFGIYKGYAGLLEEPHQLIPLTRERVRGITHIGGTIIGTTNKGDPFNLPVKQSHGTLKETDVSDQVVWSDCGQIGLQNCLNRSSPEGSSTRKRDRPRGFLSNPVARRDGRPT